jgi:hypothetical protein
VRVGLSRLTAVLLSALVPAAFGCSSSSSSAPCTTGFLGSESQPPQLEIVIVHADDSVTTAVDGGRVDVIQPPQGGRVIFAGARATNVDGCGVQLTGALRNETSRQVRFDMRTVNLEATGDGWGTSGTSILSGSISNFANVPVCPNQWSSTDVVGNPYQLEVDLLDRRGRTAKAVLEVTPYCAEPATAAYCACTCAAGYNGQPCPVGDAG